MFPGLSSVLPGISLDLPYLSSALPGLSPVLPHLSLALPEQLTVLPDLLSVIADLRLALPYVVPALPGAPPCSQVHQKFSPMPRRIHNLITLSPMVLMSQSSESPVTLKAGRIAILPPDTFLKLPHLSLQSTSSQIFQKRLAVTRIHFVDVCSPYRLLFRAKMLVTLLLVPL